MSDSAKGSIPLPPEVQPFIKDLLKHPKIIKARITSRRRLTMLIMKIIIKRFNELERQWRLAPEDRPWAIDNVPEELSARSDEIAFSKIMKALFVYNKSALAGAGWHSLLRNTLPEYEVIDNLLHITVDDICAAASEEEESS